ncbi:PilW family protein [Cupriavidus pauculus]|uniref:PilW family protein n=1 Tax=Cupriavidus pauculus TaxID=82633 RepID=UPI001EE37A50|nr:PilW family protein [Cupriavidus pauculus]GJG96629.1 pilus assembly protein PilW [Cupriavidus pauculus]
MIRSRRHGGFTLAGTMVGIALGLIATLAALTSFQLMRDAYANVVDGMLIEELGQRALSVLAHAIRQAGWIPAHVALAPAHPTPAPPLEGRDDCAQPTFRTHMQCARAGVLRSDALLVRMSGSGLAADPTLSDGTMSDCGGYALPARAARHGDAALPFHASTNFFYIGRASDGVPQLLCRYPSRLGGRVNAATQTAGTLVRGVETMQLRYGVDVDDDGRIDRFVPARAWHTQGSAGWHRVRAVQIALVVRGDRPTVAPSTSQRLTLLPSTGPDDADDQVFVPATDPHLRRRVFATTVRLRNPSPCRESLC